MARFSIKCTSKPTGKVGGFLAIEPIWIKNNGSRLVKVSQFQAKPDWLVDTYWYKDVSVKIAPEERKKFFMSRIEIPLTAESGSHEVVFDLLFSIYEDGGWSQSYSTGQKESTRVSITKGDRLNYQVFISHSNSQADKPVIEEIEEILDNCGIDTFIAEKINQAGENLWSKIRKGIDESDCVLVIWSKDGSESGDVREEIGYAFGKDRKVVPISETEPKGSIKGLEFIKLDRSNLKGTLEEITNKVYSLAKGKTQISSSVTSEKPPESQPKS